MNVASGLSTGAGKDLRNVVGAGKRYASNVGSWVSSQWTQRLFQLSVFSAVVFWVLSSFKLINQVDKMLVKTLSLKLGSEGTRALHAVIFGCFMYFISRFILDPFVGQLMGKRLVEGKCDGENCPDSEEHTHSK